MYNISGQPGFEKRAGHKIKQIYCWYQWKHTVYADGCGLIGHGSKLIAVVYSVTSNKAPLDKGQPLYKGDWQCPPTWVTIHL